MKKAIKALEEKMWLFIIALGAIISTNGAFLWIEDEKFELKVTKTKKLLTLLKKLWRERFGEDLETNITDRIVEILSMILLAENNNIWWPAMAIAELNAGLKPLLYRGDFAQVLQLILIAEGSFAFNGPEGIEVYSDGDELPLGPISRPAFRDWLSAQYHKKFNSKPSKPAITAAVKAVEHIAIENFENNKYWSSIKVAWARKNISSRS